MKYRPAQASGMALLVVLWVVAALSIFAASLSKTVRSEAALAGVARNMLQGRAYGEAAIYQTLENIHNEKKIPQAFSRVSQDWQGTAIEVEITPWDGLININGAGMDLWSMLLVKVLGIPETQAKQLAENIIQTRVQWAEKNLHWEAVEDILRVPGIDYSIFEAVQPYLVAERGARANVKFMSAPQPLREWLQESGVGIGQNSASSLIRLTAKVPIHNEGEAWVERHYAVRLGMEGDMAWKMISGSQRWHAHP